MSAYDNPTIIKDDSGMMFGQALANFGENFSKSMNAQLALAAEERKYEAKLKKETEERQLAVQTASTKQSLSNQKEVSSAVDTVKAADPVLTNKFGQLYSDFLKKSGENSVKASFSILTPEEITANDKYSKSVTQFKEKSVTSFGAMVDNVNTWKAMGPRDMLNTDWNGDTKLDQKISEISCYASDPDNYNYRDRVTKDIYAEDGDPSKPIVEIITKVDKEDLIGFSQEEINAEIKKGKDGKIIYDEATNQYSVRFKQNLGSTTWDGTFYHKIADAPDSDKMWGKTQANIVNEKGELNNSFIINPGNPVITKEKVKDFPNKEKLVETTYLNMPAISGSAKTYYDAGARALLNADLKDKTQLRSFLQNKLNRGNETLEEFFKANPTPKEQEDFISAKLFEIDTENKLGKQYSRRIARPEDVEAGRADKVGSWVYYTQKSKEVATAKAEQSGGGEDNKPTAADKAQKAFNDRISNVIQTKKGGVMKDGYTFMKDPKTGWGLYDKDGIKKPGTENISNPRELASFIGSTIPLPKSGLK